MHFGPMGKKSQSRRRFVNVRYRLYVFLVGILLLFTFGADTFNVAPPDLSSFQIISQNQLFTQVRTDYSTASGRLLYGVISRELQQFYVAADGSPMDEAEISPSQLNAIQYPVVSLDAEGIEVQPSGPPSLDRIIPAPLNPQRRNLLEYPVYGIVAPIVYSTRETFIDPNGNLYSDTVGLPCSAASQAAPIQQLLKSGIVHQYQSPMPGELYDPAKYAVTSSYIVGHSSDCTRHAYSEIFKPIEQKSQPGQQFTIYDSAGRKLDFRVFEVQRITADDVQTAFQKDFGDRRVVTLQTSIYISNSRIDRWLTRGELILEE